MSNLRRFENPTEGVPPATVAAPVADAEPLAAFVALDRLLERVDGYRAWCSCDHCQGVNRARQRLATALGERATEHNGGLTDE